MSTADERGETGAERAAEELAAAAVREPDAAGAAGGAPGEAQAGDEAGRRGAAAPPPSRHGPRLTYEAVVRLDCDGRRGIHTGFVRDLSRGGMFLRLVDPEPAGKRLGFELFLPGWRLPARGVGEVVWQRPSYEGPGRPPGMAIRFVALEPVAIEMLARVLPEGEAPAVEVLRPRPLPARAAERVETAAARERADASALAGAAAAGESPELSLEELIEGAAIAPQLAPSPPGQAAAREDEIAELADLEGPMIFVPPPPLPVPVLPEPAPVAEVPATLPRVTAAPEPRLRWGSAAAGIAAIAGLATLAVVGAARRDVALAPARGDAEVASAATATAPVPRAGASPPMAPAAGGVAPLSAAEAMALSGGAVGPSASLSGSPPAPAAPPARDAAVAETAPARRLLSLRWEPLAAGGTRLVVTLDGVLDETRVRPSRIGGEAPRLVVRLLGIADGAPRAPWEPATAEVRRVRAGRHEGDGGGELHLVLDLTSAAVRLVASEVAGSELRLDLVPAR